MDFKIAVLAGDGIGPEISVQGVDVMNAVCEKFGHKVSYEYAICGADAIDKVGDPFPEATFQACKNADAVLFSAVGDPKFDNDPTAKVRPEQGLLAMRKKLGLFANIRPVQTFKCLVHKSPLRAELVENADFICIRELTGGMYFGEKYQDNDKAYDTNMYTRPEIERILKVAFEYAMKRRKHLTVVDKANVLASSRLWRQIAQEMAPAYPEVTTDYMFVDIQDLFGDHSFLKQYDYSAFWNRSPSDRRICRSYETDDTGRFYSSYYNGSYLYCDSNRRGGNDFIFFMQ